MLRKSLLATLILSVVLGTWAVFAQMPPGPGPSFFYAGPGTAVSNNTASNTVLTMAVPAGYVTNGVHCRVLAQYSTSTTPANDTFTIAATYGTSASLPLLNAQQLNAGIASNSMLIDLYLQQTTSSPLAQELLGTAMIASGLNASSVASRTALTQTSTGALNLALAVQWGSSSTANIFVVNAANCSLGT